MPPKLSIVCPGLDPCEVLMEDMWSRRLSRREFVSCRLKQAIGALLEYGWRNLIAGPVAALYILACQKAAWAKLHEVVIGPAVYDGESVQQLCARLGYDPEMARDPRWPKFLVAVHQAGRTVVKDRLWHAPPNHPDKRCPIGYPGLLCEIGDQQNDGTFSFISGVQSAILDARVPIGKFVRIREVHTNPHMG